MLAIYHPQVPTIEDNTKLKSENIFFGLSYDIIETSTTIIHKDPVADLLIKVKANDEGRPFFVSLVTGNCYYYYHDEYAKIQSRFYALCRQIKSIYKDKDEMMSKLNNVFDLYNNGLFAVYVNTNDEEKAHYLAKENQPYVVISKPLSKNNIGIKIPEAITKKEVLQLFADYIEQHTNNKAK